MSEVDGEKKEEIVSTIEKVNKEKSNHGHDSDTECVGCR